MLTNRNQISINDEHKYFVLEQHERVTDISRLNLERDQTVSGKNTENDVMVRPRANKSVQWHRSISLSEDSGRKSLKLSYDSFWKKQDHFQFELKLRKSSEDLTDRDATQDEVVN